MWENRQQLLSQSLNYQMFLRDAKMGEVALSQQENFLSKVDTPVSAPGPGRDAVSPSNSSFTRHPDVLLLFCRLATPPWLMRGQLGRLDKLIVIVVLFP